MSKPGNTDGWCTPRWLTDLLPVVDLDPCSNPHSTVSAKRTLSLENGDDGLELRWRRRTIQQLDPTIQPEDYIKCTTAFVNPPYSKPMPWVQSALEFAQDGGTCLMLVKDDRTTRWYEAAVAGGAIVIRFKKRIRFEGAPNVALFGCALLVFGDIGFWLDFLLKLQELGWVDL